MAADSVDPVDLAAMRRQLGRPMRDVVAIAHRCPCGAPDVVTTRPRLADGTPFPTLYYLTCPRANSAISRLEADGVMRQMQDRLPDDPQLSVRASLPSPRSVVCLPAGCPTASSACTFWPRMRWPPARG